MRRTSPCLAALVLLSAAPAASGADAAAQAPLVEMREEGGEGGGSEPAPKVTAAPLPGGVLTAQTMRAFALTIPKGASFEPAGARVKASLEKEDRSYVDVAWAFQLTGRRIHVRPKEADRLLKLLRPGQNVLWFNLLDKAYRAIDFDVTVTAGAGR